jgi:hypothetical protein
VNVISGWQRAEAITHGDDTIDALGDRVRDALARLPEQVQPWVPS